MTRTDDRQSLTKLILIEPDEQRVDLVRRPGVPYVLTEQAHLALERRGPGVGELSVGRRADDLAGVAKSLAQQLQDASDGRAAPLDWALGRRPRPPH